MSASGIVIVGNGESGTRAALRLRSEGFTGAVTLLGEECHLPYERPPLSKNLGAGSEEARFKTIVSQSDLADQAIQFMAGRRARSIDIAAKVLSLDDGGLLVFDKLLLATGASPRELPCASGLSRVHYLRTRDEADLLAGKLTDARRLVIIGAGFIGLEVAACAATAGVAVVVVEAQDRILKRAMPAAISSEVQALHEGHGVQFRLGRGVSAMEEEHAGIRVHLSDGEVIEGDVAVVGIGANPRVDLAKSAGLNVRSGIVVDEALRTSCPDIYAAGDCCEFPNPLEPGASIRVESWRNAVQQGEVAADNMVGRNVRFSAIPWLWSDHYDHTVQVAGVSDLGEVSVRRDLADGAFLLFQLAHDGRLVGACGFGRGAAVARDIRVCERLMQSQGPVEASSLASPDVSLRTLLARGSASAASAPAQLTI